MSEMNYNIVLQETIKLIVNRSNILSTAKLSSWSIIDHHMKQSLYCTFLSTFPIIFAPPAMLVSRDSKLRYCQRTDHITVANTKQKEYG